MPDQTIPISEEARAQARKDAAVGIEEARASLIVACSRLTLADGDDRAVHHFRLALCAIDDGRSEMARTEQMRDTLTWLDDSMNDYRGNL